MPHTEIKAEQQHYRLLVAVPHSTLLEWARAVTMARARPSEKAALRELEEHLWAAAKNNKHLHPDDTPLLPQDSWPGHP